MRMEEDVWYRNSVVVCFSCGKEWVATRPVETEVMECPGCGEMMGAEIDE